MRCAARTNLVALVVILLIGGCATVPKPAPEAGPVKPLPGKGGGYYQDDGPGDNPPPDLQATPDALPRQEPPHRYANRPYDVLGNHYVPDVAAKPYREQGIASWYGRKFQGKKTASGEAYDMYGMTAAHRTLPIPSYARVTNLKSKQSIVVRINDRGPFHSSRIIDLSYTAALKLGLLGSGSGSVEVERVFADNNQPGKLALDNSPPKIEPPANTVPGGGGLYLQLGAFGSQNSAESFREKVRQDLRWLAETVHILARDGLYRVRIGPYATRNEATAVAEKIRATLDFTPHIASE